MITKARLTDLQDIVAIVLEFQTDSIAPEYFRYYTAETLPLESLVIAAIQSDFSFIARSNDKPIGVLLSVRTPLPFYRTKHMIEEIVWYVLPEHRNTTVGARLFLAWQQAVREAKLSGDVVTAVCHTLERSPIDLREHGFRVLQTSFYME